MKSPRRVIDLRDPGLQPYRTLRRPEDHIRERIFVAEGEKVVRRLLNSPLPIRSFLLTQRWFDALRSAEKRFGETDAEVFLAPEELMPEIVGYRLHQGIMAVGVMPEEPSPADLVRGFEKPLLLVALDGLMNSENVGVIVRSCAGFGVHALLTGENSSSPYLRRAVRNSMGAVFTIPVCHSKHLDADLLMLKSEGVRIVGADTKGHIPLSKADMGGNVCIVMGNEESGITKTVLDLCTVRVSIPMQNGTDSLNVSGAAAVILYEASRQRRRI